MKKRTKSADFLNRKRSKVALKEARRAPKRKAHLQARRNKLKADRLAALEEFKQKLIEKFNQEHK